MLRKEETKWHQIAVLPRTKNSSISNMQDQYSISLIQHSIIMANLLICLSIIFVVVSNQCYGSQGSPLKLLKDGLFESVHSTFGAMSLDSESDISSGALPVFVSPQDGLKENDKIERLPGQPDGVDFNQYSGYVKVDSERALFYYFVESPQNSFSIPLLLWFNGVPDCSSFGVGASTEIGSFRVNKDGKTLYGNQYAWNSVTVNNHLTDAPPTVLPIINELTESGIQVWIYSGDTDSSIPVTSAQYAVNKLKLNDVGGYVVEYQKFTFVRVRGAGLFVAYYKPARALALFSSFIN